MIFTTALGVVLDQNPHIVGDLPQFYQDLPCPDRMRVRVNGCERYVDTLSVIEGAPKQAPRLKACFAKL